MEKKQRKQLVIQMLTAGIITFCLLWLLFYIKKYVPFGVHSLASKDADFQYLDFLAYLKDVFDGKNNIDYSFSKSIGGACIGVFSYYLSSPFNLLLLLFDKSQLVLFVHVIITLKLACAAATFAFYLNRRFEEWNDGSVKKQALIIFLAVSYAVSQYGIAQACNIMWLDGFYMLPLIMLGVYRVVNGGRPVMLSVSVALAVLFNWYMGGINCVFACFWFLFEFAYSRLYSGDTKAEKTVIKDFAGKLGRFIYSMLAGALISGVLFLPTIGAMRYSVRGSLDFGSLLDMSFIGDVSSVIDGYSLGAQSQKGSVSLYCGCLALIGFIGIFIGKKHNVKQKILAFVTLVVMLLMFYWNPLCMAFSLFKEVGSYWYRYSHVGIFCILFFAAEFFLSEDLNAVKWRVIIASAIFSAAMLGVNYLHGVQDNKLVWLTDALIVGVAVLIALISRLSKNVGAGRVFEIIFTVILCAVLTVETGYSVMLQMDNIHIDNGESFVEYETAMEGLINDLKEYDSDTYRISQTRSRATRSLEKKKNNNGKDTDDNFKYKNNVRANYDMYPLYWTTSKEGIFMRYSYEFKMMCVELYHSGSYPDIPEGLNPNTLKRHIREWSRLVDLHGPEVLKHKVFNKVWTPEEKLELISKVIAGTPRTKVAIEAGINAGLLYQWVHKYKLQGYNGLVESKKGRPTKEPRMKKSTNPLPLTESEREELIRLRTENEYIKAENEVIKKRIALRQEKWVAQLKAKKQQSSKNSEKKDIN